MHRSKFLLSTVAAVGIATTTFTLAQNPGVNVNGNRHPNLNSAQQQVEGAIGSLDRAQRANEYTGEMGGHAQRAKQLLMQADEEIKQAAMYNNRMRR